MTTINRNALTNLSERMDCLEQEVADILTHLKRYMPAPLHFSPARRAAPFPYTTPAPLHHVPSQTSSFNPTPPTKHSSPAASLIPTPQPTTHHPIAPLHQAPPFQQVPAAPLHHCTKLLIFNNEPAPFHPISPPTPPLPFTHPSSKITPPPPAPLNPTPAAHLSPPAPPFQRNMPTPLAPPNNPSAPPFHRNTPAPRVAPLFTPAPSSTHLKFAPLTQSCSTIMSRVPLIQCSHPMTPYFLNEHNTDPKLPHDFRNAKSTTKSDNLNYQDEHISHPSSTAANLDKQVSRETVQHEDTEIGHENTPPLTFAGLEQKIPEAIPPKPPPLNSRKLSPMNNSRTSFLEEGVNDVERLERRAKHLRREKEQ